MRFRNFVLLGLFATAILGIAVCKKDNEDLETKTKAVAENPIVRIINGQEYSFQGNKVTQLTKDEDNEAVYGVISDIHGYFGKAKIFAEELKKRGVEGIIVPGDSCLNETLRTGREDSNNRTEIIKSLSAVAETGLPVFVIPGNHETKRDWKSALSEVSSQYPNVIDMINYRVFDGEDVDFVSMPGYTDANYTAKGGFLLSKKEILDIGKLRKGLDNAVVLITHGAGKTTGNYSETNKRIGPGTIDSGEDVGNETTRQMQIDNDIPFAVVGHIHEAGALAATFSGENVNPREWAKQFTANFGALERWQNLNGETYDGMAGIFRMKGNEAMYEILTMQ